MEMLSSARETTGGRRQRHPRITVISADVTPASNQDDGATREALDHHLSVAKHMLHCVFPLPSAGEGFVADEEANATPSFASLVKPRTQRFEGYSPEKTLRSVRMLVECFSPANDEAEYSGKRALSELLMHHLRVYADTVAAALAHELEEAANAPAGCSTKAGVEEKADSTAAEDGDAVQNTLAELAFTHLVALWSHFRSSASEVASVWTYLGPQSAVTCSVRFLESALEVHPSVIDRALAGFAAALSRLLQSTSIETEKTHTANKKALHDFTEFFSAIHQYTMRVQPVAVAAVRAFYQGEAMRRWAAEVSVLDYYQWIEHSWSVERARCQEYLHPETAPLLEAAIDECVLDTDITREIVQRDFGGLIESHAYDGLQLLLRVAVRGGAVESASVGTLTAAFRNYLESTGKYYMRFLANEGEHPKERRNGAAAATAEEEEAVALAAPYGVVCAVVALMQRCEDAVRYGFFRSSKEFSTPLHEGLQAVLSAHAQSFSDQLAQYLDFVMREIEDGAYPLRPPTTENKAGDSAANAQALSTSEASGSAPHGSPQPSRRSRSPAPSAHPADASDHKRAAVEVDARPSRQAPQPQYGEAVLGAISRVFSYHPNKDYFEAFYWRGLSCRLLHPYRTPNLEAEECFIRLLKAICGGSVTSKFEGMLLDVRASNDTDSLYAEWIRSGGTSVTKPKPMNANRNAEAGEAGEPGTASPPPLTGPLVAPPPFLRLHCHFFTQGFWPTSPFTVQLPPVLARQAAQLEGFYHASFNNRRLQWRHGLSTAELRAHYEQKGDPSHSHKRTYQLLGTFAQCLILMHLDEHQPQASRASPAASTSAGKAHGMTVKALCEALGMDRTHFETRDALYGLCHPRCGLVVRTPADGDAAHGADKTPIAPSDVLILNDNFASPTMKVRIPCFARPRAGQRRAGGGSGDAEHAEAEASKVATKVAGEREYMIEVAISRYMKTHRTCSHAELVEEAPKMLRFQVAPASMKKCIEKLIARNFLTRNETGGYDFVA